MKKISIMLLFLIGSLGFFAQDDTLSQQVSKAQFLMESQFYPRLNTGVVSPNLKARIVFSGEHVLRSNLIFNSSNDTREILENGGSGVGSVETSGQQFLMSLGYEHLFSKKRFSPYLGFELLFGVGKNEIYGSRTDSLVFVADYNYSSKVSSTYIGGAVFSGFDFYVYEGLYVGSEIGLQLLNSKSARGEFKQMDASSTTDPEIITAIPEAKSSEIGVSGVGVIRIGWKF